MPEHPRPWSLGSRPSPRSMYPVRDANGKVVLYTHDLAIAKAVLELDRTIEDRRFDIEHVRDAPGVDLVIDEPGRIT
jgi:hypothetical protein